MAKAHYFLYEDDIPRLCAVASKACVGLIFFAIILAIVTFSCPCPEQIDVTYYLVRNLSTAVVMALIGFYLNEWAFMHTTKDLTLDNMKYFKVFTLIAAIACIAKTLVSVGLAILYFSRGNAVGAYNLCEIFLWVALSAFFVVYTTSLYKSDETDLPDLEPKEDEEVGQY